MRCLTPGMLEVQRWKSWSRKELRKVGLSDEEIAALKKPEAKPFRPAYVDGVRRETMDAQGLHEADGTFRDRFHQ